MSLTGLPLLILAAVATVAVAAVTGWRWQRLARGGWRAVRVAGLLLFPALLVATVGLAVNRSEQFYPSWQALAGDTGTATVVAAAPQGRLDAGLRDGGTVAWRPAALSGLHLASAPRLVVPAGYAERPDHAFPVVLDLAVAGQPHRPVVADAVVLTVVPTARTTAARLASLPADLARDLRVTAGGWLVADAPATAALGRALIAAQQPGFAVAVGWHPERLAAPLAAPLTLPSAAVSHPAAPLTPPASPVRPSTAASGPS